MSRQLPQVVMPDHVPAPQRETWQVAGRLHASRPHGWTVVGGQMVQFHAWRAGVTPNRTTTDLDVAIAARTDPDAFAALSGALQSLGMRPALHPSGVEHRWTAPLQPSGSEHRIVVPVPSLLGAVLAKASALLNSSDTDPDRHLSDIVFLAGLARRTDLLEPLTPRQATRILKALDRVGRPSIPVQRLRLVMERRRATSPAPDPA